MSFGDRLRGLRLEKKMTQEDLAKLLNLSRATVGRYETNERFPDKNTLKKIADIFEVSMDYLFERSNDKAGNLYKKNNTEKYHIHYKVIKEKIVDRLSNEGILTEEELISEKVLEDIIKYGIDAAVEIAKLERKKDG